MQKKTSSINIIIIIFLGLSAALGNMLSSIASSQLPLLLQHFLPFVWPLLGAVTITLILLNVWQHRLQHATEQPEQQESSLDGENHLRKLLLERVRTIWIRGLLDKSLEGATFITPDLYERPDFIENPLKPVVQEAQRSGHLLSSGIGITQVYDAAGGELLILGEPGSGKTTLLLQLASDLLDRASHNEMLPMPVVFTLSTWAAKRQPLTDWFVEELSNKYHIPKKIGKLWVKNYKVLPLLDGFDEVAEQYRTACVSAINTYLQDQGGVTPLVIGSRITEYTDQATKIIVQKAVMVQSLTSKQINEYLEGAEGQVEVLQVAFREDASFRELMKNPLMLSILKKTYQGKQMKDLTMGVSLEALRYQVFPKYVQHVLRRRRNETYYKPERTMDWLIWLAKQMKQKKQSHFYLERLQVDWLSKRRPYQLYTSFAFGVISFLVTIPVNGVLFGSLLNGTLVGLLDAALAILFVWLIQIGAHGESSLFSIQRGRLIFIRDETRSAGRPGWVSFITRLLGDRLGYALLCGILDGALVEVLVGPAYGLVHGLFYAAFYIVLGKLEKDIQPVEILIWSWISVRRNAMSSLLQGLGIGFLLGFFDAVPYVSQLHTFLTTLSFGLSVGFAIGLVIMLMRGYSSDLSVLLETSKTMKLKQKTIKPNQGIRNSVSNSLRLGLSAGLAFGGVIFLYYSLIIHSVLKVGYIAQIPLNSGLIYGISDGLAVAYLFWLINGGFASVQHLILRVRLWQTNCIPWRYSQFLDYAHERILLHKVGGGYTFKHDLLLEYFADLGMQADTGVSSAANSQQRTLSEPILPASGIPNVATEDTEVQTVPLVPIPVLADVSYLPCGHERDNAHARFCSVCGARVSP